MVFNDALAYLNGDSLDQLSNLNLLYLNSLAMLMIMTNAFLFSSYKKATVALSIGQNHTC